MKPQAIAILALIFGIILLCIGIEAFAQEPVPPQESAPPPVVVPPVIVPPGLTVESCANDLVVITAPTDTCSAVTYSTRIDQQTQRVTVNVRCVNDHTENTP